MKVKAPHNIKEGSVLIRNNGEICTVKKVHRNTGEKYNGGRLFELNGFIVASHIMHKMFRNDGVRFEEVCHDGM